MHQETFDVWYPGYLDNIGNFRHTISFFTETALYRYATPHFYTVDEFPTQRQGLGEEMLYSSPWKGGWWHLADACQYMYEADMAVLNLSVKYREQMTYNKYRAARDTIEHFSKDPPFAYEIPRSSAIQRRPRRCSISCCCRASRSTRRTTPGWSKWINPSPVW